MSVGKIKKKHLRFWLHIQRNTERLRKMCFDQQQMPQNWHLALVNTEAFTFFPVSSVFELTTTLLH